MAIRFKRGMGGLTPAQYAACNDSFLGGIWNPTCWQSLNPPSTVAPVGAPTGSALTVPPASGADAQATIDTLVNQQMTDQQALNAGAVQSSWWDTVTGAVGSVAPDSGTSWLMYGVLAIVGVMAFVSIGGGSARRYGR
jgi:hypothetical protein